MKTLRICFIRNEIYKKVYKIYKIYNKEIIDFF